MKISIIQPEDENLKFTDNECKFIQLLEEDAEFERLVKIIRQTLSFPIEGFCDDETKFAYYQGIQFNGYPKFEDPRFEKVFDQTELLRLALNLPLYWQHTLSSIVICNEATRPSKTTPINITNTNENYGGHKSIILTITERMSIRELKKYIDNHAAEISKHMAQLPAIPKIKLQNIEPKKRILELKKQRTKDREIGDILKVDPIVNTQFRV